MRINLISSIIFSVSTSALTADTISEERESWFSERRAMIARAKLHHDEQAILDLSRILRGVGGNLNNATSEAKELYVAAQKLLLTNPDHADYYENKIEFLRAEVLANAKKSEAEIGKMQDQGLEVVHRSDYERFCSMFAFPTLSLLPSAETVRVLGSYLNDPVGRDGKTLLGEPRHTPGDDFEPYPCNAEMATAAIRHLGIEHPPFPTPQGRAGKSMSDPEVDAWKDWWNQVKDGKRTYRFIGSPIEYGPDGPASSETIQKVQRDLKRNAERAAGHRKQSPGLVADIGISQVGKLRSIGGIVAAATVVAAAIWYFLKGRRLV